MIRLDGVWLHDDEGRPLLSSVTLEVRPGEVVGVTGPHLSGKSVLLRMLAGLAIPDRGVVRREPAITVGYLPQEGGMVEVLDVSSNVALSEKSSIISRGYSVLESMGMDGSTHASPSSLSQGMARRALLARALARNPDLVVLDDPFAGLDPHTIASVLGSLFSMVDRDTAVVMAMVDLSPVLGRLTRAVVLEKGMVVFDGSPQDAPFPVLGQDFPEET